MAKAAAKIQETTTIQETTPVAQSQFHHHPVLIRMDASKSIHPDSKNCLIITVWRYKKWNYL
jgi:hypothetical protein